MQGSFNVWTEHKKDKIRDLLRKPACRHIFLYEKSVLFCKRKDDPHNVDKASYGFKTSLQVNHANVNHINVNYANVNYVTANHVAVNYIHVNHVLVNLVMLIM